MDTVKMMTPMYFIILSGMTASSIKLKEKPDLLDRVYPVFRDQKT
jgi:hypothetical protein